MAWLSGGVLMLEAIALAIITKLSYNLFLHPLRKYPGPWLARATRLQYAYFTWTSQSATHAAKLHAKYGPVVRVAPDELSYASSQAWQDIYTFSSGPAGRREDLDKDRTFYLGAPNGVDSIVTANFDDHRRIRRLLEPALSEPALRSQEEMICGHVDLLIQCLKDRVGTEQNFTEWFTFVTFDILGDLAFGETFHCLEQCKPHWWIEEMDKGVKSIFRIATIRRFVPGFQQFFTRVMFPIASALAKDANNIFTFSSQKTYERLQQQTDRPDFISYITRTDDKFSITEGEMYANAEVFIIAGADTITTALCGTLFFLTSNPSALAKVKEEIRTTFASEKDITFASTQSLTYLRAVIDESLRMYPPAPGNFPRTTPPGGIHICGEYIPGGYSVGVNILGTMHSAEAWVEPDRFAPERWLGDETFAKDDKKAFQPFSLGPRNCIGKRLAQTELRFILARLLWNFDPELLPTSKTWPFDQKSNAVWEKPPLWATLSLAS